MAKRYLTYVLASFVLAVLVASFLPAPWFLRIISISAILLIPSVVIRYPLRVTVVSCEIAVICGILAAMISFSPVESIQNTLLEDPDAKISGEIVDLGTNAAGTLTRCTVALDAVNGEELSYFRRCSIYLYCENDQSYSIGQEISGAFSYFDTPISFGNGREDRVIMSAYSDADIEELSQHTNETLACFTQLRNTIQDQVRFGSAETIGFLRSVCFGEKDGISSELYVSLKRAGLSHVMAVSGLHLSFAFFLFNYVLLAFHVPYRIRYLLGIPIVIAFTALVGFPLSCVRACIMLILFCIAMALDLFPDSLTALALAAFLIVFFNPFAVRDVGFLLSVSATAGIILLHAPIENFLFPKKINANHKIIGLYRKLTGIVACSIAASLATFAITIVVFNTFSLIAPLSNLILIYPIQLMFMVGILMVLLGWIPGVGVIFGFICDLLYQIIRAISNLLGHFSFASVSGFDFVGIVIFILVLAIFGVSLYDFIRHKRRTFLVLFMLLLCFCGLFRLLYDYLHDDNSVNIAFIDVGQGDCTVISKGHRAVIIDYGGSSEKRYELIDYLNDNNIFAVEVLAFTHLHDDHINGLSSLLRNAYVEEIYYPNLAFDSPEIMALLKREGALEIQKSSTRTVLDDVELKLVAEPALGTLGGNLNESCVCYKITYGSTSVLITGDLSGREELRYLSDDSECTILRVGHHGSATSSMYRFLKRAAPEIAIISVGENAYGLPNVGVLKRMNSLVNTTLLTMNEGTICYKTDGSYLERVE